MNLHTGPVRIQFSSAGAKTMIWSITSKLQAADRISSVHQAPLHQTDLAISSYTSATGNTNYPNLLHATRQGLTCAVEDFPPFEHWRWRLEHGAKHHSHNQHHQPHCQHHCTPEHVQAMAPHRCITRLSTRQQQPHQVALLHTASLSYSVKQASARLQTTSHPHAHPDQASAVSSQSSNLPVSNVSPDGLAG